MLKKILKIVLGLVIFIVLIAAGVLAYGLHNPKIDISPSAYAWKKNMTEAEIEKASDSLINVMTLEEKVDQISGNSALAMVQIGIRFALFKDSKPYCVVYAGENKKHNIPPIAFSDGPRGVTAATSTGFPVAMARGASWDTDLELRVANAIGKECRASNVNYFGGLCVNLLRHPAWGRAQETFGEDPYHLGEMGLSLMNGVQSQNVMACAKHYAANSIENSRFYVDVKMNERTLREVYLPHFKKLSDNGVASMMSSYNKINGELVGHSKYLINDILRDEWGFKGLVSSDWIWGLKDATKGIIAGMDLEMPYQNFYALDSIKSGIENNKYSEDRVDELVGHVLKTKLRFVTKEDSQEYPETLVANKEHTNLARESAEKSMVLLKNKDRLLPLNKSKIKKIAIIGELAAEKNLGDKGSSYVKPPYVVTILDGIKNYIGDDAEVLFSDGKNTDEAAKIAESADAVLLVAGYKWNEEGEYVVNDPENRGARSDEGGDRESLRLNNHDVDLINQISKANPNTIVSLIGGSAIIMEKWKAAPKSIIMAWYPGMEGGNALANIIFGKVNPSGKLPFTIPNTESELPHFDAFAETADYGYYHGYTLFDKKEMKPAFPFGFGLSYTNYACDSLQVHTPAIQKNGILKTSVQVKNTGSVAGEEVVQLYIGFKNSKVDRPIKLLRGFKKIKLQPNEVKTVSFEINASDLAYYNPDKKQWEVEEMEHEVYLGSSSRTNDLLANKFHITGQPIK
mgnify:CR=1 FL=1|tara:strand:- start:7861 stop:10083 length:2223 start_codon:yes stop_codon:yes gene_type:complete